MKVDELKVYRGLIDNRTLMTLYSLFNKGIISEIIGIIKEGKESGIFLGKDKNGDKIAIKVYRTVASDFKKMWKYLIADNRFSKIRKDKTSIIYSWCLREFRNLSICFNNGVSCPKPIYAKNNVLLMSFIGDDNPAGRMIDTLVGKKEYDFIIKQIAKIAKSGIVHGDLSPYNILMHKKPVIIDFSHGTSIKSIFADEMLKKDIQNINSYFNKLGTSTVDTDRVYEKIITKVKK
ncbi:MAG: RIO1 family regulatory kinase/ATPase [Candidatus Aenigmatarchaeota archaeon]|nr:serine protein kinase RIO [Candidatus Aenigmarchaeota archaeon]